MTGITFSNRNFKRGFWAIVTAGTVVWTATPHVYIVPLDTLKVLRRKRIPFRQIKLVMKEPECGWEEQRKKFKVLNGGN